MCIYTGILNFSIRGYVVVGWSFRDSGTASQLSIILVEGHHEATEKRTETEIKGWHMTHQSIYAMVVC